MSHINSIEFLSDQLIEAVSEHYCYLKQPYLDLREVSFERLRKAEGIVSDDDYGERVRDEMLRLVPILRQEYDDSCGNALDLQLSYYEEVTAMSLQLHNDIQVRNDYV